MFIISIYLHTIKLAKIFDVEGNINFQNKNEFYLTVNFRIKYFILQLIAKNVSTRALQIPPNGSEHTIS